MNPQQLPLQDIHLPADVSWWPPAPGWWILLLVILATVFAVYRIVRRWRRRVVVRPACKMARQELTSLLSRSGGESSGEHFNQQIARQLSALLRRLAISLYEQEHVAGLTGSAWWRWLDDKSGRTLFAEGQGLLLEQAAYGTGDIDIQALGDAVRSWIDAVCKRRQS